MSACTRCDGGGILEESDFSGRTMACPDCGGRGFTGGSMDSEPPSDAIGRAIVEALALADEELHERPTLPSPGPDVCDTMPAPAQEEGAA